MRAALVLCFLFFLPALARAGETRECRYCRGAGKLTSTCVKCRGKGELSCEFCYDKYRKKPREAVGIIDCTDCRGFGYIRGSGGKIPCKRCQRVGKFRCVHCKGGVVECPSCKGTRRTTRECSRCKGSGKLIPPTDPKLRPINPDSKAALILQARQAKIKLDIIALQERILTLQKELAAVEAQLATPAPKTPAPVPPLKPEPASKKPAKPRPGDDF